MGIDRKDISHEMNINFSHRNRQQLCGSLNARFWCFNQSWKWYSPSLDASQTLALSTWRSVCDIWAWILCLCFTNHLKNPLSSCGSLAQFWPFFVFIRSVELILYSRSCNFSSSLEFTRLNTGNHYLFICDVAWFFA